MKSARSTDTNHGVTGATRRQIISRCKKATTYADTLVQVLQESTLRDMKGQVLEAQAYCSMLYGNLFFEKARWDACIRSFSVSRVIYAAFAVSSRNDAFKELLSSTIDPSIRYAAYQCKLPRTKAVSDLAIESLTETSGHLKSDLEAIDPKAFQTLNEKQQTKATDASISKTIPSMITWRSRNVKIEDASIAQALGLALAKEQQLMSIFEDEGSRQQQKLLISLYEEIIGARQETVDAAKTAIEELTSEGVEVGDSRMQSLQVTKTAVSFSLIEWQIGRNRILCGPGDGVIPESQPKPLTRPGKRVTAREKSNEDSKPKRLARLRRLLLQYDSSLQSLDSVVELPGVAGDEAFVTSISSVRDYFQSLKYLRAPSLFAAAQLTDILN